MEWLLLLKSPSFLGALFLVLVTVFTLQALGWFILWKWRRGTASLLIHNQTTDTVYIRFYYRPRLVSFGYLHAASPIYKVDYDEAIKMIKPAAAPALAREIICSRTRSNLRKILHWIEANKRTRRRTEITEELWLRREKNILKIYNKTELTARPVIETIAIGVSDLIRPIKKKAKIVFGSDFLKDAIQSHADEVASVRESLELCDEERAAVSARMKNAASSIERLLDLPKGELQENEHLIPRIAICASGGGYRAMLSTLGSFMAMEENGLLDCILYSCGLSGSTWSIGAMTFFDISAKDLKERWKKELDKNLFAPPAESDRTTILKWLVFLTVIYEKPISLADCFGLLLSLKLFDRVQLIDVNNRKLSSQTESGKLMEGAKPIPIYTAVEQHSHIYEWYEFTPFEVGCYSAERFIPSWSFGRRFENGISIDNNPEMDFGILLGTFGSAFCATLAHIIKEGFDLVDNKKEIIAEPIFEVLQSLKTNISQMLKNICAQELRPIAGSTFPNAYYRLPGQWKTADQCELLDAGIDFNLPFPPLLRKERDIDIIIALDATCSPDFDTGLNLKRAKHFAQIKGFPFPEFPSIEDVVDKPISVHHVKDGPTIVYMPLIKSNTYDPNFDPQETAKDGGFTSTFNFFYTQNQADQLTGLSRHNMNEALDSIKHEIRRVVNRRKRDFSKTEST